MQKAWKAETPWIETALITLRPYCCFNPSGL